jgi:ABC-type phosphate transport system substrate-binding protein
MRKLTKILTGAAIVATSLALAMPAASADPTSGTKVQEYDLVGVGSNSIQAVMDQLAWNYDTNANVIKHHSASDPMIYSWDATTPGTTTSLDNITTKAGCTAIPRADVNGSSNGISELAENVKTKDGKYYCIDFARSSRARKSSDPSDVLFVPLARDAVTYSTDATTYAPANLTTAQLLAIYTCKVTEWTQVGGKAAPKGKSDAIDAYIPQSGSGTRSFWLTAIGDTSGSTCGNDLATTKDPNGSLEENEGTNAVFANNPNAIFPFSVGSWLSQKYRSAAVGKKPTSSQNKYGNNLTGVLVLHDINGTAPDVKTTGSNTKISPYLTNPKFTAAFIRTLYDVVRKDTAKGNEYDMDPREANFFSPKGYFCSSANSKAAIVDYGFLVYALCGYGS